LDQIDRSAQQVAQVLSRVPGAADVQVESQPGMPEMVVHLRPDRLLQFGFQPVSVMDAVQTAYQGTTVSQTYEGDRAFAVNVILNSAARRSPEDAGNLMLDNAERTRIPLRQLADIYETTGRYVVLHEATRRRQAVSSNVSGRDVASFVAEARKKIDQEVRFPAGVYTVYSGEAEAQAAARQEILLTSAIAGVGIILLLAIAFGNFRNLVLVLANLPFALAGGVLAIFFSGGWLTIGSLVGLITLFGISTRNSIMMVSHFDHLVKFEGHTWGLEAALRGASERLVPILMTALVAGLGLLPIAIGSGDPGREIEGPMAIVILGGLATSTALNLLVLPTLALRFGRFEAAS
jgi:Cu/Ag efflux pump CusA